MNIIWRDVDLKTHEINLKNAVDVKINGMQITAVRDGAIQVSCEYSIIINPMSSNTIHVTHEEF